MRTRDFFNSLCLIALLTAPSLGQQKHLWVLRSTGEMVEYDPATFARRQAVKLPPEAAQAAQSISVNAVGQILFVPAVSLPLADSDLNTPHKVWLWNGQSAASLDLGVKHESGSAGSNQSVTETAPTVTLSADGKHLFWFANQARRLQREDVDLSVTNTWEAWQTDLAGGTREDLASTKFPECRCTTGACEESCPTGAIWAPANGIGSFFLLTQFVAGKDEPSYKSTVRYHEDAGKWSPTPLPDPLKKILDSDTAGNVIVEAIPDTGCCGWSNQSDDQTIVHADGKKEVVFDEQATFKNPDYDVSFFNSNAQLSLRGAEIAMTLSATAQANRPIQISEQGQANPEESKQIRKSLAELPAVEVKTLSDAPKRIAFIPHAVLVGWISDKELLIVEDHLLVSYDVATGARRKSTIRVDDPAKVFLR